MSSLTKFSFHSQSRGWHPGGLAFSQPLGSCQQLENWEAIGLRIEWAMPYPLCSFPAYWAAPVLLAEFTVGHPSAPFLSGYRDTSSSSGGVGVLRSCPALAASQGIPLGKAMSLGHPILPGPWGAYSTGEARRGQPCREALCHGVP